MKKIVFAALLLLLFVAEASAAQRVRHLDGGAVLDRADTRYLLTRDIEVEGTAFVIRASKVTLDLGGHQVTFRRAEGGEGPVHGVLVEGYHRRDIRILNGTLLQPQDDCGECSPVHLPTGVPGAEIANLTIDYSAADTSAIRMHWGEDARIHHNVIVDRGRVVTNRHQGVAAIEAGRGKGMRIHDNVIRRTRHLGIRSGERAEIRDNEIHIDSVVVNSTGISAAGGLIDGNRITGEGVHPIGIWPGNNVRVSGNYVRVKNTRSGAEYGNTGAACLRMTWGNDGVEVTDNLFILDADETEEVESWGRALWVGLPEPGQQALFARNLIVANNRQGRAKAAGIAVVSNNASSGLVFKDNTVISNWGAVLLGDNYGHADGYARFIGNTFVRQDDHPGYRTIRSDLPDGASTGVFIDNRCLNGASCTDADLEWRGSGKKEILFGRTVVVGVTDGDGRPAQGVRVEIADEGGIAPFEGRTDEKGEVRAEVIDYLLSNQGVIPASVGGASELPIRRNARPVITVNDGEGDLHTFRVME